MSSINLNLVSTNTYLQYHILGVLNREHIVSILIDTGASFSHVHPKYTTIIDEAPIIEIETINGSKQCSKQTYIELMFHEELNFKLSIYIDESNIGADILLGTDFLENISYQINSKHIKINDIEIPRIKLPYYEINKNL